MKIGSCFLANGVLLMAFKIISPSSRGMLPEIKHGHHKNTLSIPSNMQRRSVEEMSTAVQQVHDHIKWYVRDLKEFFTDSRFRWREFYPEIDALRTDLYDIEFSVEIEAHDGKLLKSISFARRMFQAMANAAEKLKRYDRSPVCGTVFLYNIIELNAVLFSLYDYHGNLDKTTTLGNRLGTFNYSAQIWERGLKERSGVSFGMRSLFKAQVVQARATIETLSKTVDG
ncbi:hypothetical protein JCM33374_g3809 [Metschnikowia sp. JCM 33374]|nr:hypothetical protein JCM33374_g3809 [Metschnikowia sp. JCM 33374]